MDAYEALISGLPQDQAQQAQLAAALRRRRSFGELGALTGDAVLQPIGVGLQRSADTDAQHLGDARLKAIDDAQTARYQNAQVRHMDESLAETKRNNDMENQYRLLNAMAAMQKADNPRSVLISKLKSNDTKELQDSAQTINEFKELEDFISNGGKFGSKEIMGISIPGSRVLANTMASFGLGSDEDKAAFAAKQRFDRLYTLATRHGLFGASLTKTEKPDWEKANPSIRQTDAQIAKALPTLRRILEHRLDRKVRGLTKEGYSPDAILEYADMANIPEAQAPASSPEQQAGGLTPEEAAELAALRKKHGR